MTTVPVSQSSAPLPASDLAAIKVRQQATWASGDYAVIGTTLTVVGESLCEAIDLRAGQTVLDVACGNGATTLAAARRFTKVTGLDYVPSLLARAEERARAERLDVALVEGDAEAMPFLDGQFDAATSTFGVMFTPEHARSAREMMRVVRPGGRIGLANWTPEGFVGQLFKVVGGFIPPAPGVKSPALWGTKAHLDELFGQGASEIRVERRNFNFRYRSPEHFVQMFRDFYGPTHKAFGALDAAGQKGLAAGITALVERLNVAGPGSLVVPGEYLEVVITRKS